MESDVWEEVGVACEGVVGGASFGGDMIPDPALEDPWEVVSMAASSPADVTGVSSNSLGAVGVAGGMGRGWVDSVKRHFPLQYCLTLPGRSLCHFFNFGGRRGVGQLSRGIFLLPPPPCLLSASPLLLPDPRGDPAGGC